MNKFFRTGLVAAVSMAALTACNFSSEDGASKGAAKTESSTADPFASHDGAPSQVAEDRERPIMQAQISLDRLGFAPGVVDDKMGMSTKNAIKGFQIANNLTETGELDEKTRAAILEKGNFPATRMVTIPAEFANQTFVTIPAKAEEKAKLEALGYENILEALAERFHTTPDVLRALNGGPAASPEAASADAKAETTADTKAAQPKTADAGSNTSGDAAIFAAGKQIRVPNVGGDLMSGEAGSDDAWNTTMRMLGVGNNQPQAAKIVVDESDGTLQALDESGKLLVQFTATMGSEHDPLPIGTWKVNGVAHNPPFTYNPKLFWDVADSKPKLQFKPGPNSPVGVVWIDLSKEHYGIHGTPSPETIGRAESHGCVRLTNWDAARLAEMVKPGVEVVFQK